MELIKFKPTDLGEQYMHNSIVAEVNGQLWDMHRPLEDNCQLKFLTAKQDDPYHVSVLLIIFLVNCSPDFFIELD